MQHEAAGVKITDEFNQALHLLNNTRSDVFVTGKAGTGKSTLLRLFRDRCQHQPVVLAPTGVAALNVGGMTIHSFFGFSANVTVEQIRKRTWVKRDKRKLFEKLQTIIIDEVSMLRADMLDCIDAMLQKHGPRKNARFGGVRMIYFGDLYQLPPVVPRAEREIFSPGSLYESEFFFDANAMKREEFGGRDTLEVFTLNRVFRQRDDHFVDILNRIRDNTVTEMDIRTLNGRVTDTPSVSRDGFRVILTGTNSEADAINNRRLDELGQTNEILVNPAEVSGTIDRLKANLIMELKYCIDAQVMMNNNGPNLIWANGSLGKIESIRADGKPVVRLESGRSYPIEPYKRSVYEYVIDDGRITSELLGSYTQFPFQLCWALTVHKSQGKTFDNMAISISRAFAPGQIYVALSRCTALEGIELLRPITGRAIAVDPRIVEFSQRTQTV